MFLRGYVTGNLATLAMLAFLISIAGSGSTERASGRAKFDFSVAETTCPEIGPCQPGQERKPKEGRVERHHEGGDDLWKSENYPLG